MPRWLVLSVALTAAVAGTATGLALALSSGGAPVTPLWALSAVFSADGKYVVASGAEEVQVIDAASGRVLAEWLPDPKAGDPIDSIGVTRDDKSIVTVDDGYVQRWSVADVLGAGVSGHPRPLSVLQIRPVPQLPLHDTLSPDGSLLAVSGPDGPVAVWNTLTGQVSASVSANGITEMSPDDRMLAAFTNNNDIQLWKISAARPALVRSSDCSAECDAVFPFSFTSDDGVVIPRQAGAVTRLLDGATGKQVAVLAHNVLSRGNPVAYSQAAGLVAEGNVPSPGWVTVWSAASSSVVERLAQPEDATDPYDSGVSRLAFDQDGEILMVLQSGAPLWLWHVPGTVRR